MLRSLQAKDGKRNMDEMQSALYELRRGTVSGATSVHRPHLCHYQRKKPPQKFSYGNQNQLAFLRIKEMVHPERFERPALRFVV